MQALKQVQNVQQNTKQSDKTKVLTFYRMLLSQHLYSQKLSLISLQLIKILNTSLGLLPCQNLLLEFFNLLNLLIYPQKLVLSSQQQNSSEPKSSQYPDSQQQKVRDIILYLKVIKQILKLQDGIHEDDECLFTLSDVIDEQNLNKNQLIKHVMVIWERIIGKPFSKSQDLSAYEVMELQRDLEPLVYSVKQVDLRKEEEQENDETFKTLELQYNKKIEKLEQKLNAYKNEYIKVKNFCKTQDSVIKKYERVLEKLSSKNHQQQSEQNIKNKISEQIISSLRKEYNQEQNLFQINQQNPLKEQQQLRSLSPFSQSLREKEVLSKTTQTYQDLRIEQIELLEYDLMQVTKEKEQLLQEKNQLLRDKHQFSEKYSDLQGEYEDIQEKMDRRNQKYLKLKRVMDQIQEEGENNQAGLERLKEEVELLTKQKFEAETRTKKFESQFRMGLKEIDDLREQIEQLQNTNNAKDKEVDNEYGGGGSESSSFLIFNQSSNHQEIKLGELEREKDYLLQKIQNLEKSNKELILYKKSLEETINEISKESDQDKRMSMVNFNLIRKKSLLRLEQSQIFNDNKFQSPDKLEVKGPSSSYLGQRQSILNQYIPGNKNSKLSAPSTVQEFNQIQGYNGNSQIISPINQNNVSRGRGEDLNQILDEIQQIDSSQIHSPHHRSDHNIQLQIEQQDQEILSSNNQSQQLQDQSNLHNQNDIVVQNLFGLNDIEDRAQNLQLLKQATLNVNEQQNQIQDEEEEENQQEKNIFTMILKPQIQDKNINKQVIKEVEDEDEYDDEDESSSSNEDPEYD